MGLFTRTASRPYADVSMPARKTEDVGPWGAAIRYWLPLKDKNGADLTRDTGIGKNTIGRAIRGAHVNTKTLQTIATALNVPYEEVLVSPEYRATREEREQLAVSVARRVLQEIEAAVATPAPPAENAAAALDRATHTRLAEKERRHVKLSREPARKRRRKL